MTLLRRLHAMFVADLPARQGAQQKQQVLTMPKGLRLKDWHTPQATTLVRAAIAVSYALGGHMLVPWDVEIPGGRYYANASQYADLFAFVRRHADLFDAADELQSAWLPPLLTERSASNFQAVSGAPWMAGGSVLATVPAGLRECQALCDRLSHSGARRCVGVRLADRPSTQPGSVGECALIAQQQTQQSPAGGGRDAAATAPSSPPVVHAYRRSGTPAAASSDYVSNAVRVNDSHVLVIGRRSRSSGGNGSSAPSLVVLHLIDVRAIAGVGCCPSAFKPAFGYHPSNCSVGLDCCRCSEDDSGDSRSNSTGRLGTTALEVTLAPSVGAAAAGARACPTTVRLLSLESAHDRAATKIRCDPVSQEARVVIPAEAAPRPWALLEVHFGRAPLPPSQNT